MTTQLVTLLTLSELSEVLRLSPETVRDRVKRGILPAVKLSNGKLLFHPAAINRALRRLSTAPELEGSPSRALTNTAPRRLSVYDPPDPAA